MGFESWRGTVGVVKPTLRPGSLEEFIRLLPEGIGVVPLFLNIRRGTVEEFRGALDGVEEKVRELAEAGVDLIHPEGAPPFMVRGYAGEQAVLQEWRERYNVPLLGVGISQVEAMRALGLRRIVGVTYFRGEINELFSRYFREAGFEVLAMEGIDVAFDQVGKLSSHEVYAHAKKAFLRHDKADGIYMLGSGWRVLDIVEMLERDLEIPVVHPVPARVWAVQNHFRVREPRAGYGQLLRDLPRPA